MAIALAAIGVFSAGILAGITGGKRGHCAGKKETPPPVRQQTT